MMTKNLSVSSVISTLAMRACDLMDTELKQEFIRFVYQNQHNSGGFIGRSKSEDLYYTFWGVECIIALKQSLPFSEIETYLVSFQRRSEELDFVHLSSLLRCQIRCTNYESDFIKNGLICQLERFRCGEGGFFLEDNVEGESIYAAFIAFLVYQDLGQIPENPEGLLRSLEQFSTLDGAYAEGIGLAAGTTTVTSAATILKHCLGGESCNDLGEWLLDRFDPVSGGFLATPGAPVADLLSTATSLLALKIIGVPLDHIRMKCLRFIEGLWKTEGGFCGNVLDQVSDLEYTYYGFISLGVFAES